jgi:transposase
MKQSLNTGALFLFYSKRLDKLKLLYWDKMGFCLWYKRLENDKFKWPKKYESDTINIKQGKRKQCHCSNGYGNG